jgi:hypothetical protein
MKRLAVPTTPAGLDRRRFLLGGAAVAIAPLWGCGGGGDDLIAETTSGRFLGQADGVVGSFLGIP